ncbi:MAG: DUF1592 domain-containing protein [Bryobacterales bacterium]|nr:DUF1592 domain-containing protein [Bryobacterales bacterium]
MSRLFAALALAASAAAQDANQFRAFVSQYCESCHGARAQMAQRRFDRLQLPPADPDTLILLQDMVDQLNLSHMPPPKAKQPTATEKQSAIAALTKWVAGGHAKLSSTGGRTVLRRLNKREYLNTIGDLFAMNMIMFDPGAAFPRDQMAANMDNIGDTLVTSGYLLDQYLSAAGQIVEKALRLDTQPETRTWTFNSEFRQQQELDYAHKAVYGQRYLCLYETMQSVQHEGAYGPLKAFSKGVPADGFYEIRVLAEAKNRRHPYNADIIKLDPEEPFRLGVVPGNEKAGPLHHPQPIEPLLAETVLGDAGPEWKTFRVWLDAGYTPRFVFPNGMINGRGAFTRIIARHKDLLPEAVRATAEPRIYPARPLILQHGFMPHIRIHEVRIEGPFYDSWPPSSRRIVLGDAPFTEPRTREILHRFATRAYRRPARPDEVDRLMQVVAARRKAGSSAFDALKDGLKAALCSPAFLYLAESETGPAGRLSAHALASRLSYFLWSSMPDEELLRHASAGALLDNETLRAQTRRMLAHPRSEAFVAGFLDSWLNLRSLGDMPPDRDSFERFYGLDLQNAMKQETRLFARHLLERNEPIRHFLDGGYSFLNRPLAKLYGIAGRVPAEGGQHFRLVEFDNPRRGGLLGHGSILTVSANGIETSPVTRGVWLLENIFGTPPAPPPDNVPAIDPDIRGAKTMRDILTKHCDTPTCFACHRKIDPPGFALENFDPIGAWRTHYKPGIPVDSSGTMPDGQTFTDVSGLKKILVANQPQFARMLTGKLLAYATGRRMEPLDRPRIERITRDLAARGGGFRDLVELAVLSEIFRSK